MDLYEQSMNHISDLKKKLKGRPVSYSKPLTGEDAFRLTPSLVARPFIKARTAQ